MIFSSALFLFAYLPLFVAGYFATPIQWRNAFLVFGSVLFYAWTEPTFIFWALGSTLLDYWIGGRIAACEIKKKRAAWVGFGIAANIALLGWFKYSNFGYELISQLAASMGIALGKWVKVALPIAVSFIVFEKITYLVDIYRRDGSPARNLLDYVLYVFYFPKLLAGPIIRYKDIQQQIQQRHTSFDDLHDGAARFVVGLGKKVLIADHLGAFSDKVFATPLVDVTSSWAWLGVLCFTFQIYYDFSGYSDMAIGLSRMLGFRLNENFRFPYLATSITEFWRRWHISLSTWIRDYLYIPLGGNRCSKARNYLNLFLCFFLCGLWHGAAWPFIFWGVYQGALLMIDKLFWLKLHSRLPALANHLVASLLVCVGWVVFRSQSAEQIQTLLSRMFFLSRGTGDAPLWFSPDLTTVLLIAFVGALRPALPVISGWSIEQGTTSAWKMWIQSSALLALLLLSISRIATETFQAFLYFRF